MPGFAGAVKRRRLRTSLSGHMYVLIERMSPCIRSHGVEAWDHRCTLLAVQMVSDWLETAHLRYTCGFTIESACCTSYSYLAARDRIR